MTNLNNLWDTIWTVCPECEDEVTSQSDKISSVGLYRTLSCDCTLLRMMYDSDITGSVPFPLTKRIPYGTFVGDLDTEESITIQSASLPMGDDVVEDNKISTSTSQQINVNFSDENSGEKLSMPTNISYLMSTSAENVDLGSFLERPVLILTDQWTEGTTFTSTIQPWLAVLGNPVMKRKLENFYLLRANLNIKVVINASPFYYGGVLVSYTPLAAFSESTAGEVLVPLSQRPHFYIYPQSNQGGEMKLPFMYYQEWLDLTSNFDVANMGTLNLNALGPLRNANDVAGQNVTIKVYAWLSEVELDGTTEKLSLQSASTPMGKDEYCRDGAVSKPASAIARASGALSDLPIVGPFMTATSVAAGAVANIASLFGYTDVPVIADVHSFKNTPFPQLATTDVGVQFEKLSLDAKNELTIDPRVNGIDASDEMQISTICQRESFLTTFPWTSADPSDTHLFTMRVFPEVKRVTALTSSARINYTPMGYLSEAFAFWRGDIKIRLKFLCSQYHRGRVLITWDPTSSPSSTANTATQVYTQVVDLAEDTDVEFNIPYIQPSSYLRTGQGNPTAQGFSTTPFAADSSFTNGNLSIFVLNDLTSPNTTADIDVAVFIRGGENMEFANPKDIDVLLSPYTIQSGSTPMSSGPVSYDISKSTQNIGGSVSKTDTNLNLVYNGECVTSLRQIIRRTNFYNFVAFSEDIQLDTEMVLNEVLLPRLPLYPGYDTAGIQQARNNADSANVPYNWSNWSFLSFFQLMFIGVRGSVNYMVNKESSRRTDSVFIERSVQPDRGSIPTFNTFVVPTSTVATDVMARTMAAFRQSGESGVAITNQQTQSSVLASVPFYSRYKFLQVNSVFRSDGQSIDDSDKDNIVIGTISHIARSDKLVAEPLYQAYDLFISAGTDMSFIFFLSAPSLVRYNSIPGPPA